MVTRRSVIQTVAAGAVGLGSTLPARGQQKATAFAITGDRYHNSDYIRTALSKTLVRDAGLSIDFTDDSKALTANTLAGYKMLIIFRGGMWWPDGYPDASTYPGAGRLGPDDIVSDPPVPRPADRQVGWMSPEQGKLIKNFVSTGGSILLYHNVTSISRFNDDFREVLGAITVSHPPIRRFRVKVVNRDHPITKGVNDFMVTDEQHFMTYQKDPKNVLLRSVNEDGLAFGKYGTSCEAGWACDYGKGRLCYFAPGHMIVNLWNPEYEKLQHNAVRWLLRQG